MQSVNEEHDDDDDDDDSVDVDVDVDVDDDDDDDDALESMDEILGICCGYLYHPPLA